MPSYEQGNSAAIERQRDIVDATKCLESVITELESRVKTLREQVSAALKPDLPSPGVPPQAKVPEPSRSPMAEGLRTGVRRLEDVLETVNDMLRRNQL